MKPVRIESDDGVAVVLLLPTVAHVRADERHGVAHWELVLDGVRVALWGDDEHSPGSLRECRRHALAALAKIEAALEPVPEPVGDGGLLWSELVAQRDRANSRCDESIRERDGARKHCDAMEADRDRLKAKYAAAVDKVCVLLAERDRLKAERDRLEAERDQAVEMLERYDSWKNKPVWVRSRDALLDRIRVTEAT